MRLFLQECESSHQDGDVCATLFVRWIFEENEREPVCQLFRGPETVIASMNPVRPACVTLCTRNGCQEECFTPKDSWNLTLDELANGVLFTAENPKTLSSLKEYVSDTLPRQIRQKMSLRRDFWLRTSRMAS